MVINIQEILKMASRVEMELFPSMKQQLDFAMKESLKMKHFMAMESITGKMEIGMREHFKKV